jgi:hypothetical protein
MVVLPLRAPGPIVPTPSSPADTSVHVTASSDWYATGAGRLSTLPPTIRNPSASELMWGVVWSPRGTMSKVGCEKVIPSLECQMRYPV